MVKILCTNDDGYNSKGLEASINCAKHITTEVAVYAPEHNQTATGGKTRFYASIGFKKIEVLGLPGYAIDGTPMEVMRFALTGMKENPDLVVSGINFGEQIGAVPIFMSGTCAAAFMATALGIPALAVGYKANHAMFHDHKTPLEIELDDYPGKQLEIFIRKTIEHGIAPYTFLNINFPAEPTTKIKVATLEHWGYWDECIDIIEGKQFKINGFQKTGGHNDNTDADYFNRGYIVVTPIRINMCDETNLSRIAELFGSE